MVFLSFDTEEFDVPYEHDQSFDVMNVGMEISRRGTLRILDILNRNQIKATFFCTTNFASNAPDVFQAILDAGHEVASHGCCHWNPKPEDAILSKGLLETLSGKKVFGYRQPRMFPTDAQALAACGYLYNASLNPTFIPGRYTHLSTSRLPFYENGILQIPSSVTPVLRIPLFWYALHVFPLWLYKSFCRRILRHDKYFNTYFHPWEFTSLQENKDWTLPLFIRSTSGENMCSRLQRLIDDLKSQGESFGTYRQYLDMFPIKGDIRDE